MHAAAVKFRSNVNKEEMLAMGTGANCELLFASRSIELIIVGLRAK